MSQVYISLLEESIYEAYDRFLKKQERSLLYYSLSYKLMLEKKLGAKSYYFIAQEGNEIIGAFPLMIKESRKYGKVTNSLPFYGSNGGIILSEHLTEAEMLETWMSLVKSAEELIERENCVASTIITSPFEKHINWYNEFCNYNFIDERIGQITELPENIEQLSSSLHSSRRRNIKKAINSQVEVIVDNSSQNMEFLYQTHVENMRQIGGLAKEKEFFELIPEAFSEYKIYTALHNGKGIAALLLFYFNKTVEYFTPVTKDEFRNMQPMSLILIQAMQDAIENGYKIWNWGGTWKSQDGVYAFKKRWNATDFSYKYFVKCYDESITKVPKEELLKEFSGFYVVPFSELDVGV